VYDALEKVVLAGLADQAILNTKPISRVEAARIVAQAVRRLESGAYGDYYDRPAVEELLYRIIEEFGPELTELGVRNPLNREATPSFFGFEPVEHAQFASDFSSGYHSVINRMGREVKKGGTVFSGFDGRLHIDDLFSLYYQPELIWGSGQNFYGRVLTGYAKLTYWNTELLVGREPLWWGPGFRGSMTFSNNGFPLDHIRLSSAEPFRLPWLLRYLGPIKLTALFARLDDERDVPRANLGAWRINLAPFRNLEVGFSRVFQFGGEGRGGTRPGYFFRFLFEQGSDESGSRINVNNLMSLDVTFRWPNAGRYIWIARDLMFYGEMGWDDTQDFAPFLFLPTGSIVPRRPGGLVGLFLTGFLGDPHLDFRIEYARTSIINFTHDTIYFDGFTHRGRVLSHFVGTEGSDLFFEARRSLGPDLKLGVHASRSKIGSTSYPATLTLPREQRTSFGFDLTYFFNGSAVFMAYDFARVKDRNFVAGKSGNDHLFSVEYTRQFDW
jgi:hypothetical protein